MTEPLRFLSGGPEPVVPVIATPENRAAVKAGAIAFCERFYLYNAHALWGAFNPPTPREMSRVLCSRATDCPVYMAFCYGEGRDCDILARVWYRTVMSWCGE